MWRSGSQIVAQISMWASTFFVIRLLNPKDYGLFAMTQGVLVLLTLLNGQVFAGALIRAETITTRQVRQVFGLLILLNVGIALLQVAAAPLAARYFRHPIVAEMLTVQALLYLANPFIVLPGALLARAMDFHRQAKVNLVSAAVGALTSLTCALAELGVWTLVFAPLALIWTRAIGMTFAARRLVWPSFDLRGASATIWFGSAMLLSDLLWLIQTQADVFIGGRTMNPHRLGILYHLAVSRADRHQQVHSAAQRSGVHRLCQAAGRCFRCRTRLREIGAHHHARCPALLFRAGGDGRSVYPHRARAEMGRSRPRGRDPRAGDAVCDATDPVHTRDDRARAYPNPGLVGGGGRGDHAARFLPHGAWRRDRHGLGVADRLPVPAGVHCRGRNADPRHQRRCAGPSDCARA